jgi:hypothetical protein
MRKILFGVIISACLLSCKNEKEADTPVEAVKGVTSDKKPASELLELSTAEPVKKSFEAFAKGDVEGMVADFDENVRYTWSGGDSLVGKKAVMDYYKGRWDLFESISFNNPIVLPVQVNESQQPKYAPTGKWVLYWAMVDVKYKNGKAINFWMHNVNHFNEAGKIDFIGQYIDRLPIMDATKGLMKK